MICAADVDTLILKASKYFGVEPELIKGKVRYTEVVEARHTVWCVLTYWGMPQKRIGRIFGVDHSSVSHAVKKAKYLPTEKVLRVTL